MKQGLFTCCLYHATLRDLISVPSSFTVPDVGS